MTYSIQLKYNIDICHHRFVNCKMLYLLLCCLVKI